jgi:hypothetical protein
MRGRYRACKLEQRDVRGRAMRKHGLRVELRMGGDLRHVTQLRGALRVILDDLVGRAVLHAVGGGEHDGRRDHGAAAEVAARAYDGDDISPDPISLRSAAANDCARRRRDQREDCQENC